MKSSAEQKIMEYVERARCDYFKVKKNPIRYRVDSELERIESKLVQIECLAFDLGLIKECTL